METARSTSGRRPEPNPAWRSWRIAPQSGPFSKVQTQVATKAVRLARQVMGDRRLEPHADLSTRKYVSHQKRFILAPVPKCGTKTLRRTFFLSDDIASDTVEFSRSFDDLLAAEPDLASFYTFSFVRNPWARVVSCWNDKIILSNSVAKILILSRFKDLSPKMPFEAFVEWLTSPSGSDDVADRHWLSQSRILGDHCNFVGKLENYGEDIQVVAKALDVGPIEVVRENAKADYDGYRPFYNERTRKLVADRYAEDVERFQYTF